MLIYDGDCGFCTATARWVADQGDGEVEIQPWQSLDLDDFGLTMADVTTAVSWIDDQGAVHRGHAAIGRSLEAIGSFYRPLGWLVQRPPVSWTARPAYWLVARYRYRLPGATNACRLG